MRKSTVQHIGHSPVLDASLAALVGIVESLAPVGSSSSLSRLQLCRSSTGPLHKYTSALGALRESLDNPVIRYQRDTLLAVFVLSSCHMWLVDGADESRGHMDGLAHLITAVLNKDVQLQDQAQFSDDALKLSAIQLVRVQDHQCYFLSSSMTGPWNPFPPRVTDTRDVIASVKRVQQ